MALYIIIVVIGIFHFSYVDVDVRHGERFRRRRFFRYITIEFHVVFVPFDGVQRNLLQIVLAGQRDCIP